MGRLNVADAKPQSSQALHEINQNPSTGQTAWPEKQMGLVLSKPNVADDGHGSWLSGCDKPQVERTVQAVNEGAPLLMELNAPEGQNADRRKAKKPWVLIDTAWLCYCNEMATFPAGFKVNVYDGRLTSYFEIPSEWIVPTHGGIRYIEHFNETGPYSRFRFQLCHNFLNGRCNKGFTCTYVHAKQVPRPHEVHVQGMERYDRLPAGFSIDVHLPGSTGQPQAIPSQFIIRTLGAERLYVELTLQSTADVVRPLQHCAHFLYNKLCNRGAECAFIHVFVRGSPSHHVLNM